MMMKRLLYILICVLLLASCSDEISLLNKKAVKEGDPVTLTVSIQTPGETTLETRALGEMTDDIQKNLNLWLLVFDENSIFVQAAQAQPSDNVGHNGHTDTKFTVTLNTTSAKRIIHFIAYDGGADEGVGAIIQNLQNQFGTEATMLQQLYTENNQAAYWQRWEVNGIYDDDEETTGVNEATVFECVPLVRNFSKVTITNNAANFTILGYTIVNKPSRGAVAPYSNGSFIEYVNDRTNKSFDELESYPGSSPSGTTYSTSSTMQTEGSLYLYETPNAEGDDKGRTSIIIQGRRNGATYFYKVDLVYYDTENEAAGHLFYNILRNFNYNVKINEVSGAGYSTLAAAIAGAASNNLSASTATSSLSVISDGTQKLEVTETYFCFTESGVKQVLKYKFSYKDGNNWVVNNDLVDVTSSNNALFNGGASGWSVLTNNDADGWRTITMDLNSPTAQAQTSIFHIYASIHEINNSSLSAQLKQTLTSGEMLYRNVQVELRKPYTMLVDCPSYVPAGEEQAFQANLLIPQNINEALFPMDFLIEAKDKYIYPNASSSVKLPVHIGQSIVEDDAENSFQYSRTITKEEYRGLLDSTNPSDKKTVNGVNYVVVPCYFKTSVAASATTIYAYNEYFNTAKDAYLNVPVAFQDDTELTVASDYTEYFGKGYPITIKFNVAASTTFTIKVTEGGVERSYNVTPPVGEYTYTYNTQTINGNDQNISVSVSAQIAGRDIETKSASLTMNRRYFVIKAGSFTTNITTVLDEGQDADGSLIYIDGTYVGWFGRGLDDSSSGYLTNQGPRLDYVVDRFYQNNATLTEDMVVIIQTNDENYVERAYTTIGQLDDARNGTTFLLQFARETNP